MLRKLVACLTVVAFSCGGLASAVAAPKKPPRQCGFANAKWSNVTSERSLEKGELNKTSRAIQVSVRVEGTGHCGLSIHVNEFKVGFQGVNAGNDQTQVCSVMVIVPAGASYVASLDGTQMKNLKMSWFELQ